MTAAIRAGLLLLLLPGLARAEPYLATREGYKCGLCHVNTTGGGMRSDFGGVYAQNVLAADRVATPGGDVWSNALDMLLVGGDVRADYAYASIPNEADQSAFEQADARLYFEAKVVPDRLVVYADQRIGPASLNEEAWARLGLDPGGRYYVKAGKMYLPYGWRLQDQTAFIRAVPGINMDTPDNGVELGLEQGPWTAQLALSNGAGGGAEADQGKQATARAEFVQAAWRLGASAAYNGASGGTRRMGNVFAGLRTGPIAWLGEADYIVDQSLAPHPRRFWAGLLEGNWQARRGHNLKLTAEYFDPDQHVANDGQARYSALWEYSPIQFVQLRIGARFYEGIPQSDLQNRRLYFAELHGFF